MKTVAQWVLFQGQWRRRCVGRRWFADLNFRAFQSTKRVAFFISFICYLYDKRAVMAWWYRCCLVMSKTWVRVPGLYNFLYYFSIVFPMQLQWRRRTICLNIQRATRLAASNQRHGSEEHATLRSIVPYAWTKVKQAMSYWARISPSKPHNWGLNPPLWFAIFFTFYSFFLMFNYCFICFYFINLINYFFLQNIKTS